MKPADFLHDDLENRIPAGDIRFSVMALHRREEVRLGAIVITGIEPNEACDAFMFDPGISLKV